MAQVLMSMVKSKHSYFYDLKIVTFETKKRITMKKVLVLGLFGAMALASCKKDWTCKCTSSIGGSSSSTIADMTKKDAKVECDKSDASAGGVTVDCELQ